MEEIELTYLPKNLPEGVFNSPRCDILDIYIPSSAKHPVLRIRKAGDKYEITKKSPLSGTDSSRQLETTIPLTKGEFDEFEKRVEGKRVLKTRYYYEENGLTYEVGIFREGLEGLVLVDVEFKSHAEKDSFGAPVWLLVDVTQSEFVAGGMLCGKKYADIEPELRKFGYTKWEK